MITISFEYLFNIQFENLSLYNRIIFSKKAVSLRLQLVFRFGD